MAYAEVSVIVDGALDKEETFHDYALQAEFIDSVREDARSDGYPTEVYILDHDHDHLGDGEECACIQYAQDHRPAHAWNMDGPGTGFGE